MPQRSTLPSAIAWMLLAVAPIAAGADTLFDSARTPGQPVVLTRDASAPSGEDLAKPPMLARTNGIVAELKGKQIAELIESVDARSGIPHIDGSTVCVVHIGIDANARHIRVVQGLDGGYVAEAIGATTAGTPAAPRRAMLKPERFDRLLASAGPYFGGFGKDGASERRGEVFEVAKPYQHGLVTLDARTIQDRLGVSGYIRFDPVHIDLAKERFFARLPKDYRPEHPAGLLVWMDPGGEGRPPGAFDAALDRLNVVCIGAAGAGNDRGVTDRLQLALDAAATAARRWHIDPQRVYVAGASGGAKMASILMPCFPDLLNGAVAIVGLASWRPVPTGDGAHTWPAEFTRPGDRLWRLARERRLAAATGSNDFNRPQILKTFERIKGEGPATRLFDIPGMGHELPQPDAFGEQLGWVDGPAAQALLGRENDGAAALDKLGDHPSPDALLHIVQTWPWTRAAWRAIELLPPAHENSVKP